MLETYSLLQRDKKLHVLTNLKTSSDIAGFFKMKFSYILFPIKTIVSKRCMTGEKSTVPESQRLPEND